jgi:hypothetical protein
MASGRRAAPFKLLNTAAREKTPPPTAVAAGARLGYDRGGRR